MFTAIKNWWTGFQDGRPELSKFLMFLVLSNGVTVLQLALMPIFRWGFATFTGLTDVGFQALPVGSNVDGSQYYMFDYAAGALPGGGGGLAYFLAVQITLLIAQVINFFLQRNITFKSNTSVWVAAGWYTLAYIVITFVAAAAQGVLQGADLRLLHGHARLGLHRIGRRRRAHDDHQLGDQLLGLLPDLPGDLPSGAGRGPGRGRGPRGDGGRAVEVMVPSARIDRVPLLSVIVPAYNAAPISGARSTDWGRCAASRSSSWTTAPPTARARSPRPGRHAVPRASAW